MERIITYDELPFSNGQSIYLRDETDPNLKVSLISKGYQLLDNVMDTDESTIFLTGARQVFGFKTAEAYREALSTDIEYELSKYGITKPKTQKFSIKDLIDHKYQLPFVLKNEKLNGGKEKFLIKTEKDYENLILSIDFLLNDTLKNIIAQYPDDPRTRINYARYLNTCFSVQEYIETPSEYNTTIRLLTTPNDKLLYGALKYKEKSNEIDNTTLLGYLLGVVYPLSTPSIVSNTVKGGVNILLDGGKYPSIEKSLLECHGINSSAFQKLIRAAKEVHKEYHIELGILCGFDFIYDQERKKWFLLEFHDKPMVGDYSNRQGINYETIEERLEADGKVRATALSLTLKKTREI